MIATIELTPLDLGLAALLILLHAGIALALRLSLGREILLAAVRAVVQLSLLGLVLGWVFGREEPWIVVALMLAMTLLAGWACSRRLERLLLS